MHVIFLVDGSLGEDLFLLSLREQNLRSVSRLLFLLNHGLVAVDLGELLLEFPDPPGCGLQLVRNFADLNKKILRKDFAN